MPGGTIVAARQGAVGVAIFFVISGFVLYRPSVVSRITGAAPPNLARYARRRITRILPAFWIALTAAALLGLTTGTTIWRAPWIYYGFTQGYSQGTVFNGLVVAWSLGAEVVFYALLPIAVWAITRSRLGDRAQLGLVVARCCSSPLSAPSQ